MPTLPLEIEVETQVAPPIPPTFHSAIENACARVAPLWPLKNFVAVNPFVGLSNRAFLDTCALVRRTTHGEMLMPLSYYAAQFEAGRIGETDLQHALDVARHTLPAEHAAAAENLSPHDLKSALKSAFSSTRSVDSTPKITPEITPENGAIFTVTDAADYLHKTQWTAFVVDEISKWCSAYFDEGQASWRMPWRGESLFSAWKEAALRDANPEMMGLHGFRKRLDALPDNATATIEHALGALQIPPEGAADFLHRQLMSISGWSGYVQFRARENAMYGQADDSLRELLAIRLAYEVALFAHYSEANFRQFWARNVAALQSENAATAPQILLNYLWQAAAENAYQRALMQQIADAPISARSQTRPDVQAIFCIDVRSEVFRRSLEATSLEAAAPQIETVGFAGFFGFPIEFVPFGERHGATQCPVLLTPKFRICEEPQNASPSQNETLWREQIFSKRLARSWSSFKTSAVSCFSFVETGGLLAGAKLVKDSLGIAHKDDFEYSKSAMAPCVAPAKSENAAPDSHSHLPDNGMSLDEQIAVARGALTNMGLTKNLARVVVICGHGSQTANNPYGSGLDCGACGGHSGEANARVAAMVLNNKIVRDGLKQHEISIPDDTIFVAALHNTTTDDVTLFPEYSIEYSIPETHRTDIEKLRACLETASHQTRLQRAKSLGLGDVSASEIDAKVRARSHDWAQTRPEWGLAGNAAFIAAPRRRTAQLNLGGRAFLNNYEHSDDTDGALLTLVMTAPMVVASWINLQYFASTVNNRHFGSGNKTIHNVVGALGIWQGNSGDLQVGLPLQSLHDGEKWMHEPLRLNVFIEAPRRAIDAIIEQQDGVRELLDNGWLNLFAIENEGRTFARYCGDLHWKTEDLAA